MLMDPLNIPRRSPPPMDTPGDSNPLLSAQYVYEIYGKWWARQDSNLGPRDYE